MVRLQASIALPCRAAEVWLQLRDFRRFAALDVFHQRVEWAGSELQAGTTIRLEHRFCGFTVMRHGRILLWRENRGYAFSDLSRRGPRHGFPHIFMYRLEDLPAGRCRLHIIIRGSWTARAMPDILVRLWLAWVLLKTRQSVQAALLDGLTRFPPRRSAPGCRLL